VACALCLAPQLAPGQPTDSAKPVASRYRKAEQPKVTKVYTLKYADSKDIASAVEKLVGRGADEPDPPRVVADPRTNSLVVAGTEQQQERIAELIESLDVPPKPRKTDGLEVRMYELRHAKAKGDSLMRSVILPLLGPRDSIAMDGTRKRLIVMAEPRTHVQVEQLIKLLDVATPPDAAAAREVRVVWLVADPASDPKSRRELPPDVKHIPKELAKMGVEGLQVAARFMALCAGTEEFLVGGEADVNGNCQVEIQGQFVERPATRAALKLKINARQERPADPKEGAAAKQFVEVATVHTTISAPSGHAVVLGVAPMGKMTSVFVVTIEE
jgi:hypothetical protein